MQHIGKRIKARRLHRDLTQERLAELLNVSAQAVSKWETEASWPDVSLLPELSAVLGVTLDELFDLRGNMHLRRIEKMLEDGAALSEEDFRYAEAQLREGCGREETRAKCLTMLAELYLSRAEKYKNLAADCARQGLELEPWSHANHSALCQAANGVLLDWCCTNHTKLIDYYKGFVEKNPDHAPGYLWYLDNLIADGRLDEARGVLEQMRRVRDSYHYELYLGYIAEKEGDYPEAEHCWDAMVEKYPDVWFVWSQRADSYAKRAQYGEALRYYREAIARQSDRPRFTDNYDSIAQICELTGDRAGAVDAWEHVLEILRDDWDITEGETVEGYRKNIAQAKAEIKEG